MDTNFLLTKKYKIKYICNSPKSFNSTKYVSIRKKIARDNEFFSDGNVPALQKVAAKQRHKRNNIPKLI